MSTDPLNHPIDAGSAERLATDDLRLAVLDTADATAYAAWLRADLRGFHARIPSDSDAEAYRASLSYRRHTGVWDAAVGDEPVATVSSWRAQLTVPGPRTVDAWAISSVTVSPTHRRRGIARALLEGELRTARDLDIPVAMLTVSEATIYGRFGFAPAVGATNWSIETSRVRWVGIRPEGVVRFLPLTDYRDEVATLHERLRPTQVGATGMWGLRWDQFAGRAPGDAEKATQLRAVKYVDGDGAIRGLAVFRLIENTDDFTKHTLVVDHLISETHDAYAALWRFVLEMDLVSTVTASLRSVDEPLWWMLGDRRAATVTEIDHLWARILDVPRALEARAYPRGDQIAFEVSDALGFAEGSFVLREGIVDVVETVPAGIAHVRLDVSALSSLYLGGVSAVVLAAAGRLEQVTDDAASAVDATFRTPRAPWLSEWF